MVDIEIWIAYCIDGGDANTIMWRLRNHIKTLAETPGSPHQALAEQVIAWYGSAFIPYFNDIFAVVLKDAPLTPTKQFRIALREWLSVQRTLYRIEHGPDPYSSPLFPSSRPFQTRETPS